MNLFISKKRLLSRIKTLEDIMIDLIAAKDTFEHGCRACSHHKTIKTADGRVITYCELYVKGYCHDFNPLEGNL